MNKKEEVINTARELFTEYGYKKVSMDEIARESNVTKKTIYSYFNDKEAMFKYFVEEELQKMKEQIEINIITSSSFIERVAKILYQSLLFRKSSDLIKTISKEVQKSNTAECISFLKYYDAEIINYIEEKIKIEINNNTIKKCDAHLTAFIIYKVYSSLFFEYDREINEEQVTIEVTNILKDGLLNEEGFKNEK